MKILPLAFTILLHESAKPSCQRTLKITQIYTKMWDSWNDSANKQTTATNREENRDERKSILAGQKTKYATSEQNFLLKTAGTTITMNVYFNHVFKFKHWSFYLVAKRMSYCLLFIFGQYYDVILGIQIFFNYSKAVVLILLLEIPQWWKIRKLLVTRDIYCQNSQ